LIATLLSGTALAHPGHGEVGPTHYLTEPEHLLTILIPATVIVMLWMFVKRARWVSA
jgi:hypothetical protein